MNRNLPSRAQRLHCRQTRIVQPALIEKLCRAVWTSGPRQRRDGVDYEANVLYISRFFEAMLHKDAIARIIDPYGGPIGPKLHCSCPAAEGLSRGSRLQLNSMSVCSTVPLARCGIVLREASLLLCSFQAFARGI